MFAQPPLQAHHSLKKKIDATSWGLLFLMTGVLMVLPNTVVPEGAWLILAGAILVGTSIVRYVNKLGTSAVVIALGVLGIIAGISSAAGLKFPFFAAFLVLVGATIVLRSWIAHGEA
jgi:hypothetical protein